MTTYSVQQQNQHQLQAKLQNLLTVLQLDDAPAGGSVVVYHQGQQVASTQVGYCLPNIPWSKETLAVNFSTGKGILVTLIHVLVSKGLLEYDEPIVTYWKAFGVNGKDNITLRDVLTHRAGLFDITRITSTSADMLDWVAMVNKVANMTPTEPENEQAKSVYSALVSGWVLGGLIEKVTNLALNSALKEYLTEPLGIADCVYFGVPDNKVKHIAQLVKNFDSYNGETGDNNALKQADASTANTTKTVKSSKPRIKFDSPNTLSRYKELPSYDCWQRLAQQHNDKVHTSKEKQPSLTTADINRLYFDMGQLKFVDFKRALLPAPKAPLDYYSHDSISAKIPAANGVASASALALIYAMLAEGGTWEGHTFIDDKTMQEARRIEVTGSDAVMPASNPNSMLWRLGYHRILSVCHDTRDGFGHMGYNGSFGYCDSSRHLAFAFTHNFDVTMMTDVRQFAITEAILTWIDAMTIEAETETFEL